MTCRCDCLPKAVPKKYFNFVNAAPVNTKSKVAQFEKPIVAVKHVKKLDSDTENDKKDYIFAMFYSNQLEEPTFLQLMHCLWLIYMRKIAVRAGDSRRGHGGLR